MAEAEIADPSIELKFHATFHQPFLKWPHHGVILVVDGSHDPAQRIETRNHMGEAQQITLEFDRAVPGLKGKSSAPHKPEISLKERRIEVI